MQNGVNSYGISFTVTVYTSLMLSFTLVSFQFRVFKVSLTFPYGILHPPPPESSVSLIRPPLHSQKGEKLVFYHGESSSQSFSLGHNFCETL